MPKTSRTSSAAGTRKGKGSTGGGNGKAPTGRRVGKAASASPQAPGRVAANGNYRAPADVNGHHEIVILGAREHNLQNIDVRIPRDRLVVITGLSGSGKSSLAFDTIYAEGQRKYVESLSAYARQFLEQLSKPDV